MEAADAMRQMLLICTPIAVAVHVAIFGFSMFARSAAMVR